MNYQEFISTRQRSDDLREFEDCPYGWRSAEAHTYPDPIPGFAYCGGSYAIEALHGPEYPDGNAFRVIIQFENDYPDLASAEFVLFYHYGRFVGQTVELNLFERLEMACRSSNLDDACRFVQDALGVESGDHASIFFSYCTGSDGPNEENWRTVDTGTRWGWMADYIRSELSVVDGRLQGDGARFGLCSVLKAKGFSEWQTGGGCMALSKEVGMCSVLVTDGGGLQLPEDGGAWMVGAHDEENQQIRDVFTSEGSLTIDEAIEQAIELAKTADMEQSARRRGDIKKEI